jgi:hypothetical protein
LEILDVTIAMKVRFLTNNSMNCQIYNIQGLCQMPSSSWKGTIWTTGLVQYSDGHSVMTFKCAIKLFIIKGSISLTTKVFIIHKYIHNIIYIKRLFVGSSWARFDKKKHTKNISTLPKPVLKRIFHLYTILEGNFENW